MDLMGRKDRNWIRYVERGTRQRGEVVELPAAQWYHLATVVGADPWKVLEAAGVPRENWPNVSNMRSNSGSLRTVDIADLSEQQATLVEGIVDEFRRTNDAPGGGR